MNRWHKIEIAGVLSIVLCVLTVKATDARPPAAGGPGQLPDKGVKVASTNSSESDSDNQKYFLGTEWPNDIPGQYLSPARAKYELQDYQGAWVLLNAFIKSHPGISGAYSLRGDMQRHLGYDDDAFADFAMAIKLNPHDPRAYLDRALVEMGPFQDTNAAFSDIAKAIQLFPKSPNCFVARAWCKRRINDISGAIQDLRIAIQINPACAAAYSLRGCIKKDSGQLHDALGDFRAAVQFKLRVQNVEDDRIRIWQIRTRMGEREAATVEMAEHLKALPETQLKLWPTPVEFCLTGSLSEEEVLKTVEVPRPRAWFFRTRFCEACYDLGMKHLLQGDKTGAAAFFQRALAENVPGDADFESAKLELDALKNK